MYYEEKLINGIMHYRNRPDVEFTPFTLEELSARYRRVELERNIFRAVLEAADYQNLDGLAAKGDINLARRIGEAAKATTKHFVSLEKGGGFRRDNGSCIPNSAWHYTFLEEATEERKVAIRAANKRHRIFRLFRAFDWDSLSTEVLEKVVELIAEDK